MTKKHCIIALCAFLLALIICAGLALAAAITTRTIDVNYYNPEETAITPISAVPLDVPYEGSSSVPYTIGNPTPSAQLITCSHGTLPAGVTVTFSHNNFTLAKGTSQEVVVTVSCTGTPTDGPIEIQFTSTAV